MTEKTEKAWKAIGAVAGLIIAAVGTYAALVSAGVLVNPRADKAEASTELTTQKSLSADIARGVTRNLPFGGYTWRVLDMQGDRALLITEEIIEQRSYHDETVDVTWETCTLRTYLNSEFYRKFSAQEQAMILETSITNADNQWYGTNGGRSTRDKVFLLSLEEVVKYFGDSGQLENRNPNSEYLIDDKYNGERVAYFVYNSGFWWWLRSPGFVLYHAAYVDTDGDSTLLGDWVNRKGGVRPALWYKL